MRYKHRIQKVNISQSEEGVPCRKCGANILDIKNFKWTGEAVNEPMFREEYCECRECGSIFTIRYNLFDEDGHIRSATFSGDVNNPKYNWQDSLTDVQKTVIADHLESCDLCKDRLSEEMLEDAWFADILHLVREARKKNGK